MDEEEGNISENDFLQKKQDFSKHVSILVAFETEKSWWEQTWKKTAKW